ncbi:MAG: 50S ribosomal protein L11 methyltransferase [Prevotella sp.]|nr:50S ribosomal protein L11 methyltransferase [Prevotella sp.]
MKYYEIDFNIRLTHNGTDDSCNDNEFMMQNARDIIAAVTGEAGLETFEYTDNGLKGYVQTSFFNRDTLDTAIDSIPLDNICVTYEVNEAEDKDWNETWENEGFEPITVNSRCVIHDGRHLPEDDGHEISIEIDARMAFGTGTHETTRMVAATLLDTGLTGKNVLDCGCGTGILSIIALKCGAAKAVGYDIDEWSVDNSRHNAVINRVEERFLPILGDASVLAGIDDRFDVVTANINRNILLNDMAAFRSVMTDGAMLILSGFYSEDTDVLTAKAAELGLAHCQTYTDNGWACMTFRVK